MEDGTSAGVDVGVVPVHPGIGVVTCRCWVGGCAVRGLEMT